MAPQFLSKAGAGSSLAIERSGTPLATTIEIARDSASRRRGLLGRDGLPAGHGFVIAPCQGVHTFGMRFPIDIVAVDRDGVVIKIRSRVPSRRIVMAWSAFAIIELAVGAAERARVSVGDRLILSPAAD